MNKYLLLIIKKHTDTLVEETRIRLQETLEFKMYRQMQTFSFNPPINLIEEGYILGVTSFECTNSVFIMSDDNNRFSITIPGHWNSKSAEENIDELNKLLKPKSENIIELHVREVRERGHQIKIGDKEDKLSGFDTSKKEKLEELKNVKYNELEDMVYKMQLTYDEIVGVLELKYVPTNRIRYSSNPGLFEITDINTSLERFLPDIVKVKFTIDHIRLKSNLKINQTIISFKKSFCLHF